MKRKIIDIIVAIIAIGACLIGLGIGLSEFVKEFSK